MLIPLGLTTRASAADAGIHKKILGSGMSNSGTTTLTESSKEMTNIFQVIKSPKFLAQTIENAAKKDLLICCYNYAIIIIIIIIIIIMYIDASLL